MAEKAVNLDLEGRNNIVSWPGFSTASRTKEAALLRGNGARGRAGHDGVPTATRGASTTSLERVGELAFRRPVEDGRRFLGPRESWSPPAFFDEAMLWCAVRVAAYHVAMRKAATALRREELIPI
jgi:hypothetical protein